MSSLVLEA